VNAQLYEILRNITTNRENLVEEIQLDSGDWHLEYAKRVGNKKITILFPKVKAQDKASIARLGLLARKIMLGCLGFAYVQESNRPDFPPRYMLHLLGYGDRQRGWMREQLNRLLVTLGYASYTIENKDGTVEDIGHFVNRVRWVGERAFTHIVVEFNEPVVNAILPEFFDALEAETKLPADKRFVNYPLTRLVVTREMREYTENLLDYLITFEHMGEHFYPIKERTLIIEGMGMTPERIKHIGEANCSFALIQALMVALKQKILTRFAPAYDIIEPKKGLDALVKLHFHQRKKLSYVKRKIMREGITKKKEEQRKRERQEIEERVGKDEAKQKIQKIKQRINQK